MGIMCDVVFELQSAHWVPEINSKVRLFNKNAPKSEKKIQILPLRMVRENSVKILL